MTITAADWPIAIRRARERRATNPLNHLSLTLQAAPATLTTRKGLRPLRIKPADGLQGTLHAPKPNRVAAHLYRGVGHTIADNTPGVDGLYLPRARGPLPLIQNPQSHE